MSALSDADRRFLNENFKRYGSGWAGGLDALARDYDIEPEPTDKVIRLRLTLRAPPALRYTIEVERADGAMGHSGPDLPEGPSLSEEELARVDEILRRQGELWLVEPANGDLRVLDLAKGAAAVRGEERELETRRLEDHAVLVTKSEWGDAFCLWLDLDGGMEGVAWVELPMSETRGRWLTPSEVKFLDDALRENGDFGVYGNVRDGLRSLVEHMNVRLREDDSSSWSVSASPRDGHGHFLDFAVDKKTGAIGDVAAGHEIPEEEYLETPIEPE